MLDGIGPTVALDPGGTTGAILYMPMKVELPKRFVAIQFPEKDHHWTLWNWLYGAKLASMSQSDSLTIICEKFEFRKDDQHREKIVYDPAEYIGVVKLFAQTYSKLLGDIELHMQGSAQAKGFWDNQKIKRLGLWIPGKKHSMDALRHFLYWVTFVRKDNSLLGLLKDQDLSDADRWAIN